MPRSYYSNRKPILKSIIDHINSENLTHISILDLGIGCGNFGKLIKKKLDVEIKLSGVEIWEKYENNKWDYYDEIIISDIRDYVKQTQQKFDIILFIDVLEHFNQEDGKNIITSLIRMTKRKLIISTPVTNYPQGSYRGNPYEEHKYFWSENEFEEFGFKKEFQKWIPTFSLRPLFSRLEIWVLTL